MLPMVSAQKAVLRRVSPLPLAPSTPPWGAAMEWGISSPRDVAPHNIGHGTRLYQSHGQVPWPGFWSVCLAAMQKLQRVFEVIHFMLGFSASYQAMPGQTVTCVPTSTTRPVGIWKKSVASLADLARPMNSRSCQRGMPEWTAGLSARRDRKNDVDMMSKCQPCLRATASAFGTFGDSM